jgi:hypothetical protein
LPRQKISPNRKRKRGRGSHGCIYARTGLRPV